jgi:CheY-like chemotaxis protein
VNILIVNDDPALLDALSEMLTMRIPQATVSTSDNPRHTLNTLDTQGYDLVIADVKMPGMDGFTFVRAVTAKYPAMPIIMLTGHGESHLDQRAIEAGHVRSSESPSTEIIL